MKIRDAKPEELAPKPRKQRVLTPRQIAAQKRDQLIHKTLNEIAVGPLSGLKKIELESGEKLATIRQAVSRQIAAHPAAVNMSVRDGAIYLSRSPIPGARAGRPRKKA